MAAKGKIIIDPERCKNCELCIIICPYKLISKGASFNSQGVLPAVFSDVSGKCTGCGVCYLPCPHIAITVFKEEKEAL